MYNKLFMFYWEFLFRTHFFFFFLDQNGPEAVACLGTLLKRKQVVWETAREQNVYLIDTRTQA